MLDKCKIIFCGLDEWAFDILLKSKYFEVMAVNYLADMENHASINPVDFIFNLFYRLLKSRQSILSCKILNNILRYSHFLGSRLVRKYYPYLNSIYCNNISIIDFSNISETVKYIQDNRIDLLVVSNWWLLPNEIIYSPKHGAINIHPSKLPEYRGSVPTLWSLKYGRKDTAVTLIKMNSKIDDGDIIFQHDFPISSNDDAVSLENKCCSILSIFLEYDIVNYINGNITPSNQDRGVSSVTAKYYEYMKIEWENESSAEIVNKIKLYPYLWPLDYCYGFINESKITFYNAELCHKIPNQILTLKNEPPGTIKVYFQKLFINTLNGVIKINLFRDLSIMDSIIILIYRKTKMCLS